jgi:hypothetical protein
MPQADSRLEPKETEVCVWPSPLLHLHGCHVWFVDVLGRELCQLWHKAPDEAALRVILLTKGDRAAQTVKTAVLSK